MTKRFLFLLLGIITVVSATALPGLSFDKYRRVIKTGKQPLIQRENYARAENNDPGEWHNVSFKFRYDSDKYEMRACYVFNPLMGDFDIDENTESMELPENFPSTFICIYGDLTEGYVPSLTYLIYEDVKTAEDMEISFDPDDAIHTIEFRSYNPDGSKTKVPAMAYDPVTWEEIWDMRDANTFMIWLDNSVYIDDYGRIPYLYGAGIGCDDLNGGVSGEVIADIRVNSVSEKVHFLQGRYIVPQDEDNYLDITALSFKISYLILK